MGQVRVYTTRVCPYCTMAKRLLAERGIEYEEIDVTADGAKRAWLVEATGRRTVPQVFIRGEAIGGYDDLAALDRSGELGRLLNRPMAEPAATPRTS
jgi:glutaredoxin 3